MLPLPSARRLVHLIGLDDFLHSKQTLSDLLDSHQPQDVQLAAVAALAGINHADVGRMLLSRWPSYTPPVRSEVIQALVGFKNRIVPLLDAIEAGKIAARDIPGNRRSALMRSSDEEIRARATKLFSANPTAARKDVIDRYMPAAQLKGNAAAGRKIYEAICIACHRLGDQGNDGGPNLATVGNWSPEQILVNVIDPNREVAPAFVEYVVELNDGETLSGIIADETTTSVTLKWSGGQHRQISRQEISKIAASKLSLMPEGVEGSISIQQMADLIVFIRGLSNNHRYMHFFASLRLCENDR